MSKDVVQRRVGEVVQTTSSLLVAQCTGADEGTASFPEPPPLGAFVYVSSSSVEAEPQSLDLAVDEPDPFVSKMPAGGLQPHTTFGIVCFAQTSSLDPGRRSSALGLATVEELRISQPQIFELLTTDFVVQLTSYTDEEGNLVQRIPPRPPHIHSFVYCCEDRQLSEITRSYGYLRSLVTNQASGFAVPVDDVIAANLSFAWKHKKYDQEYLVSAGKTLLSLLQKDYDRFQVIMDRVLADTN